MLSYLQDQTFVEFALEKGGIPFVVRGSLTCVSDFNFTPFMKIRISGPTYRVRAIGKNKDKPDEDQPIRVHELLDEVVFPGEIELPEKTKTGISKALYALELWADFLCIADGNPKITVEIQHPTVDISIQRTFEPNTLYKWADLFQYYLQLEKSKRKQLAGAIWWYRKACNTSYYSLFDSYTAYWNCLKILCDVSGSKVNQGELVDRKIRGYLKNKRSVKAGHILHCYNSFVNYSIKEQMKDALIAELGKAQSSQIIYQCFEVRPEEDRLYQIRNNINHGNIRENTGKDYTRVYFRRMLLSSIVMMLIHKKLGSTISVGKSVNELAEQLNDSVFRSGKPTKNERN